MTYKTNSELSKNWTKKSEKWKLYSAYGSMNEKHVEKCSILLYNVKENLKHYNNWQIKVNNTW